MVFWLLTYIVKHLQFDMKAKLVKDEWIQFMKRGLCQPNQLSFQLRIECTKVWYGDSVLPILPPAGLNNFWKVEGKFENINNVFFL